MSRENVNKQKLLYWVKKFSPLEMIENSVRFFQLVFLTFDIPHHGQAEIHNHGIVSVNTIPETYGS